MTPDHDSDRDQGGQRTHQQRGNVEAGWQHTIRDQGNQPLSRQHGGAQPRDKGQAGGHHSQSDNQFGGQRVQDITDRSHPSQRPQSTTPNADTQPTTGDVAGTIDTPAQSEGQQLPPAQQSTVDQQATEQPRSTPQDTAQSRPGIHSPAPAQPSQQERPQQEVNTRNAQGHPPPSAQPGIPPQANQSPQRASIQDDHRAPNRPEFGGIQHPQGGTPPSQRGDTPLEQPNDRPPSQTGGEHDVDEPDSHSSGQTDHKQSRSLSGRDTWGVEPDRRDPSTARHQQPNTTTDGPSDSQPQRPSRDWQLGEGGYPEQRHRGYEPFGVDIIPIEHELPTAPHREQGDDPRQTDTDEASGRSVSAAGDSHRFGSHHSHREQEVEPGTAQTDEVSQDSDENEDTSNDQQGLTQEARSRGGRHSAQAQERDEQGRFQGKGNNE